MNPVLSFNPALNYQHLRKNNNNIILQNSPYASADVDMNVYNLPIDTSIEQWAANLSPGSIELEAGVFLGAKDSRTYFVDTVQCVLQRTSENPSLGLELLEIAGGREDGLGITIVTGAVEGGNAENIGFVPGDSIGQMSITVSSGTATDVSEQVTSFSTECLSYDATVDTILGLPPPPADGSPQIITMKVKRLRRKPKVKLTLQYPPYEKLPDETIELFSGENLRRAMLTRGVKLNDALSRRFDSGGIGDCGAEGTCATCVVSVQKGMDLLSKSSIQEQQMLAKNPKWRMACKAIVGYGMKEGEMTVQVNPRQWK